MEEIGFLMKLCPSRLKFSLGFEMQSTFLINIKKRNRVKPQVYNASNEVVQNLNEIDCLYVNWPTGRKRARREEDFSIFSELSIRYH